MKASKAGRNEEVSAVRDASRRLVREFGFLTNHWTYGERVLSHSKCHALLELAHKGSMTGGDLAERLRLDKSSMSRALGSLVSEKLVRTVAPSRGADGRQRPFSLASAGRATVKRIDREADTRVADAFALLEPEERAAVVRGMALYATSLERARKLAGVELRPIRKADDVAMAAVIRTVMTEFGAVGSGFSIEDPEVDHMCRAYRRAGHAYSVALRGPTLLGGAGVAPLDGGPQGVCELRKMFVVPAGRGLGLGRLLLTRTLEQAKQLGFERCYLETLERMQGARRLYERFGFRALDGPMGATGHGGCNRWMMRDL